MEESKIVEDGMVAVAVSLGYGAGWTTWNGEISPFEPKVIEMIKSGRRSEITKEWCEKELGLKNIFCDGAHDLCIQWVKQGEKFAINEYDGSERLYISSQLPFTA